MFSSCGLHSSCQACLALLGLLAPQLSLAAFGGAGGYEPPAPNCKPFTCPAGSKPVGEPDHQLWSYGCKDSGMNIMSMGQDFDPNDPLGSMKKQNGKNVDKCCVERDICKQTCGTTAKECHNSFWACSKKMCKGDQNCEMSAMMASFSVDDDDKDEPKKDPAAPVDYEADRNKRDCRGYEKAQEKVCKCIPNDKWQDATEKNLKAFYKTHNPDKLGTDGEIKDLADVWKKWKGKEPAMFQALATKYKAKAVMMKTKPKPPPYKPPPPLSKEEQAKEDKRMEENRAKWAKEDAERAEKDKKEAAQNAERRAARAAEKEEEARRKQEEEDGETVEL